MPKTAANAPPLTPGKINPEPINIPSQTVTSSLWLCTPLLDFPFCLFPLFAHSFFHLILFMIEHFLLFYLKTFHRSLLFFIHFDNIRIKHVTSIMIEIAAIVKQGLDPPISVLFPSSFPKSGLSTSLEYASANSTVFSPP